MLGAYQEAEVDFVADIPAEPCSTVINSCNGLWIYGAARLPLATLCCAQFNTTIPSR
jgi:hypothetical protein